MTLGKVARVGAIRVGVVRMGAVVVCFTVFVGCEGPERISVGGGTRQIKGSALGAKANLLLPVAEVRASRGLSKELDGYLSLEFVNVTPALGKALVEGVDCEGDFQSFGLGVDYFPFDSEKLGFEAGGEIFRADYELEGVGFFGLVRQDLEEDFWGWGGKLGLVSKWDLQAGGSKKLVLRGGYRLTDIETKVAKVDADGFYFGLGLDIEVGKNKRR